MDVRSAIRWGGSLLLSLLVHGLLLWPAMAGVLASSSSGADAVAAAMPVPEVQAEDREIAPGVDRSAASTITWVGYEEYEEHLAQRAEFEQAAFALPSQADQPSAVARGNGGTPEAGDVSSPPPAPSEAEPAEADEAEAEVAQADAARAEPAEAETADATAEPAPVADADPAAADPAAADPAAANPADAQPAEPRAAPDAGGTLDGLPETTGQAPDAPSRPEPSPATTPAEVDAADAADPSPARDPHETVSPREAPVPIARPAPDESPDSRSPEPADAPAAAPRFGPSDRPGEVRPSERPADADAEPAVDDTAESAAPSRSELEPRAFMPPVLRQSLSMLARQSPREDVPPTANPRPSLSDQAVTPPGGLNGQAEQSVDGAEPASEAGEARPRDGTPSDRESPATSRTDVPLDRIIHGRPIAREGVTITPRAIDLLVHERVTGIGSNPVARISFRRDGKPEAVELLRATGNPTIDQAVQSRLYAWRARGAKLSELGADDRLTMDFRIVLNPRLRD
ncbi:MAG: hypothetical protein AB8G96_13950 [Phycisphaerales bacterium]